MALLKTMEHDALSKIVGLNRGLQIYGAEGLPSSFSSCVGGSEAGDEAE